MKRSAVLKIGSIFGIVLMLIGALPVLPAQARPLAQPTTDVSLDIPAETMLGQSFTFTVTFDNNGTVPGYGPFIDLIFPATGADGNDGLTFNGATYLGAPLSSVVLTFPAPTGCVAHPYAVDTNGAPVQVCGTPGDQLVVLLLPFGSFVPDQPPVQATVNVNMSNFADVGTPLTFQARGGYQFGETPVSDPATDPSILGGWTTAPTTPTLIRVTKTYLGPEDETATGPNFPRTYRITVDIAAGQTITNLTVTDLLPPNLAFLAVTSTSPGGATVLDQPVTPGAQIPPNNDLVVRWASVTGGAGASDAVVEFTFYAPLNDASGNPILAPATGDDVPSLNDSRGEGNWTPLDPRDTSGLVTSNLPPSDYTITLKSIAIQKSVANLSPAPLSPGDTLEYTLQVQVSDFFALTDIVIDDLFSDGQAWDATFTPTLSVTEHGATTSAPMNSANYTVIPNAFLGFTEVTFRVSSELQSRGLDRILLGGCVPDGGTGGPVPDCGAYNGGATTLTLRFRTVVQENFLYNYPSGDPSVDQGDILNDLVTVMSNVLSVANLTPTGEDEQDSSGAEISIPRGTVEKTIYAINGIACSPQPCTSVRVAPADTVTYRLRYTLPTSDVENLYLIDYLPLPVFHSTEVTTFDPTVSPAAPPAGQAKFGPADTFYTYSGIVPALTTSAAENSLRFTYGSYDDTRNQSTTVDILFTVTVRSDPFADGLYLTNQVRGHEGATNAGDSVADSIVQIQLTEPVLNVRKGVVWAENAAAVFNPAQVAPAGVTFLGSGCPRFTGTVNSSGLAAQPINSNITGGVDAGDRVTFAITVENTGSGLNGAFDVRIADTLPAGMTYVPGSLCVTDGTGAAIGYSGVETDLFNTGIVLNDPGPTANPAGALDPYDASNGRNIAIVTFDVTLDGTVQAQSLLTNTGRLTGFAGSEGGANHVPSGISEMASVSTARPSTAKTLVGTEINSAVNSNTQAVIGELATYEVTITVPEGVLPSAVLTDTLDSGLAFVDCLSITASPDLSTDLAGGFAAACNDPANPAVSAGGGTVTFNLGTLTNANRNNAQPETLTIRYTAVVLNVTGNQAGTQLNNLAALSWSGGSLGAVSAPNVTVIEPSITTTKTRSPLGNLDAGDVVTFDITLTNPNGAADTDAYDVVMTDVVPALFTYVPGSLGVVSGSCSAGVPVLNDATAPTLTAAFVVFPRNTSCTLRFQATVNNTVRAGNPTVTNTAAATWTSLSGSPGDRSPYNTSSEERDGSGAPLNDYLSSGSVNVQFANTVTSKFLVATSEAHTSGGSVAVGEIVRYRLVVSVPEGTQPNFQIRDNLPPGLTFLNDGTATLAFVSNGAGFTSTGIGIVPAIPAGCTVTGNTANAATPSSPLPCTLADGNIGSDNSTVNNVDIYTNAGGTLTGQDVFFKLGNLVNADSDADYEYVVIEFNAFVDNNYPTNPNDTGDTRGNSANTYVNGSSNSTSNTVNVVVAEPLLTISKTASIASGDAGDPVTFTITVGAQSGANRTTAFDLVVSDTLDGYLVPGTVSVTSSQGATCAGGTPFNASASFAGQVMTMNAACLDPGQTITITIDATISPSAPNGFSISNTATVTYTSLPGSGTPLGTSTIPGGDYYGERNGTLAPNPNNDYRASSTAVIVATNSPQIAKSVSPMTYTIGDLVTYNLLVTLPEGVTQALVVTDDIPVGLQVESYQIITSAAASGGLLAADYNGTLPVPTVTQAGGSGGDITFNFGDTPTTADNVANNNAFLIQIAARVLNIASNVDGVVRTNTATVTYNGPAVPPSSVNLTIIEPTIVTTKSVTPNANVQAGDLLTYTVRFTNTGNSPAYDITAVDTLAQGVAYQSGSASCQFFDGVTTAPIAVNVTDTGAALTFSGVPADAWDLPATNPDAYIECTYQALALSSLHLDGAHVNTIDADWSSHNGSDAFERVYDDTTPYPNDGTQDTASAAFTSPAPAFSKSDGGLTSATIGQVISYTLTVQSPLGTLRNLIITDTLPAGLIYQTGSLSVSAGITAPVSVTVSSPNDGTAPVTLTVDFGNAVVSSSPVTLTFTAQVANVAGNQQGVSLNNTASLTYTDATGTTRTLNASDPVTLVEPAMTLSKAVVPPTPADAGGAATYTLVLANPGGANVSPAYDVHLVDTLPAGLTLNLGSVSVVLAGGAAGVTDASAGNTVDLTIGVIPPGGSATVTFTATLDASVQPGQAFNNIANADWTSLSGSVSGERDGSGGVNDYRTSASANFTSAGYTLSKALVATSAGHTSGASLTVGETVTFELAVSLPEGTIPAPVVVTDDLPAGLAYVTGSGALDVTGFNGTVDSADPVITSAGGSGDDVVFTFNQPVIVNADNDPANNTLRLRLTARVVNELANQNGVTLTNHANLQAGSGPVVQASPVTVTLVEPDLALNKTASTTTPGLGQVVTFTLTVAHSAASSADAQDVVLTDVIPAGLTYVPGSLASSGYAPTVLDDSGAPNLLVRWDALPLGQNGVITYQAQVTTPSLGTAMTNNAGLVWTSLSGSDSGERDGSGGVNDYLRASSVTLTSTGPDLQISKSDGGVSVIPGGTITYTLNYSNTGNGAATSVVVSETVPAHTTFVGPAGWTCTPNNNAGSVCTYNLGTLNPGASGSLTYQVQVVNPVPAGVTQINNVVYIADDGTHGNDPTPGNNTSSDETPVDAAPDLTVSKTDGGVTAEPGDVVAYTLSYANVGNQAAENVVLTETVPANSVFNAGASTIGWNCTPDNNAGSTCTLSLGTLAGGASGTATFAVTVDNPLPAGVTQIANTVVIADDGANGADPTPGNNTSSDETPVDAAPDLTVSKTDGGVTAEPGDVVAYTISYANVGNQAAENVALTETVPANSVFNAGASTIGWNCTPDNNAGSTCTLSLGTLAGGASGTVTFGVTVDNPLPAGVTQIANTVVIADDGANGADPTPGNNTSSDETPVDAAPDLTVSKTDGGVTAEPGDVVAYTLSYANVGNQAAENVVLTETVPANSVFNAGASTIGWNCTPDNNAGSTCTLSLGTLAGGASGTVTFAVTVDNPLPAGVTQIANTVVIADDGANGADPTPGNNTGSDETPVDAAPDLTVSKTDGGVTAEPGDVVAYTLSYANVGNQAAENVVLTETVPANSVFNAGASTVGWSCVPDNNAGSTCTLSLGTLAGGASGTATFAVTVNSPLPAGVHNLSNTVIIADDGTNGADPTPDNNTSSDTTPLGAVPDLTIEKSDGVDLVSRGETLVYTLTVRNVGNQDASGVVIEETVPSGTTFAPASSTSGWACTPDNNAGSTCTLSLGSLAAGATVTVQFAVVVDASPNSEIMRIWNTAEVRDDGENGDDPTPDNNTSTDMDEIGTSAKQLVATNQDFTANPEVAIGEVLTYEISLDVPAGSVQNLVLTDTLDRGLAFIGCDSITADPAVTASAGPLTAICNTASITAEPAGSTNPADAGRKMTLNFGNVTNTSPDPQPVVVRYRVVVLDVAENISGVTLNNHAQWNWVGGSLEAEASPVRIIEPRLRVEKTVAPREAMEGQEVTFTITLSRHPDNEGPAHNVVLSDVVPYGLTYVPGSWQFISGVAPTTLVESGAPTLTATWDVFPADAPATVLQFRARVTNIKPGNSVTNVAQVVWSSLPDHVGAPQSPYNPRSVERSYVPGSSVDVYGASGEASLLVPELELPKTGFAPGVVTQVPAQPAEKQYADQGMTLEIPALGVKAPIMGVPLTAQGWDLTWLSHQVGYLEGTAFPTWKGNSGLTAHVYGPDGKPGPFVNLGKLKWGDTIIIHYAGQEYRYAVRVVKRVQPNDLSVLGHQERAWLTLITCQGYNQQTNDYASRVVVQAVLMEVK